MRYTTLKPRHVLVSAFLAVAAAGGLTGCDSKFKQGDCAELVQKVLGTDLKKADCADHRTLGDPVYRVNQVLSLGDQCPPFQGFTPVQLDHEPDDATYCLVLNT
jgi:hypothetical protein